MPRVPQHLPKLYCIAERKTPEFGALQVLKIVGVPQEKSRSLRLTVVLDGFALSLAGQDESGKWEIGELKVMRKPSC